MIDFLAPLRAGLFFVFRISKSHHISVVADFIFR